MKKCAVLFYVWLVTLVPIANAAAEDRNVLAGSDTIRSLVVGRPVEPAFSNTLAQAQSGDVNAQVALGNVFSEGLYGVPRNADEAFRWYQRAALAGNSVGQFMLASSYEQGKGTPKNLEQAANWYKKSANQGYVSAQSALGNLYLSGQGVERNPLEAYKWLAVAAAHGDMQANEAKLKLAKGLSLREITDAEYRAGSFRPVDNSLAGRKPQDDSPAPKSLEAGFFITTNGYFLAPLHVIKDAKKVMVKTKTGLFPGRLVKADISADLALLKVEGAFVALMVATRPNPAYRISIPEFNNEDWKAVRVSLEPAKFVGRPAAATNSFLIQMDHSVENAGGCVVDATGAAVGLATFQQFASNQINPRLNVSTLSSLKRMLRTLPQVEASVKWAAASPANERSIQDSVLNASALVLAY